MFSIVFLEVNYLSTMVNTIRENCGREGETFARGLADIDMAPLVLANMYLERAFHLYKKKYYAPLICLKIN